MLPCFGPPLTFPNVKNHEKSNAERGARTKHFVPASGLSASFCSTPKSGFRFRFQVLQFKVQGFRVQGQGGVRHVVTQCAGFIYSRLPQTYVCSYCHPPVHPEHNKKKEKKRKKKEKRAQRGTTETGPKIVFLKKC